MADQVTINMPSVTPAITEPLDSADGRNPRSGERESRDVQHCSNGKHHAPGESTDDSNHHSSRHHHHHNGRRRSRSRSRSASPSHSPHSHRNQRNVDEGRTSPTEKDVTTATNDVEPLLTNNLPRRNSESELDEDSNDEDPNPDTPQTGVDDGFFVGNRPPINGDTPEKEIPRDGTVNHSRPLSPGVPHKNFPFALGLNPNDIFDENGNLRDRPEVNLNVYQQKKNLAQGMMDLALLSANANQLRYLIESFRHHPYFFFSVISISISLILQIAVGIGLILNSKYNVNHPEQIYHADKLNNFTIIGIFLITIVNVFVSAFGVADADQ